MKKAFALFLSVVLLPASQSFAWSGGPFSGNSRSPVGDDGIYEAVCTMSNGVGLFRFAVRNNGISSQAFAGGSSGGLVGGGAAGGGGISSSQPASSNVQFNGGILSAYSSNVWYYKGVTYYGVAFGTANSEFGIVSAIGNAVTNVGGEVPVPATGQIVFPAVNATLIGNPTGNNIGFANSQFIAKMEDKGPAFRFSGKGQVSFLGAANSITRVEAINPVAPGATPGTVTPIGAGPTGANNPAGVGNTRDVEGEGQIDEQQTTPLGTRFFDLTDTNTSVTTSFSSDTLVSTGGEDEAFPQRGHVRSFVVFGNKVQSVVFP